jgi:ATP-dependent RNA helicase DeaD
MASALKRFQGTYTVLRRFRAKGFKFLVTTNVLARGIDLENLGISVNFDLPVSLAEYMHRAGRTGRAGNAIKVLSLVPSKEEGNFRNLMSAGKLNFKNVKSSAPEIEYAEEDSNDAETSEATPKTAATAVGVTFKKIHLNRGKSHKIRPGDVLGGLVQKCGLQATDIGSIYIYDHFTHVDVSTAQIKNVLAKMEGVRIKNLSVRASLAAE